MSQDMSSSWKYLSAASSRLKNYTAQQGAQRQFRSTPGTPAEERPLSWREWAGEKLGGNGRRYRTGNERLAMFPGWAARRYSKDSEFSVDVFVSGYASVHNSPDFASRSQRAFMRLARGFAALPKLASELDPTTANGEVPLTRSTEELLAQVNLPPRPDEVADDFDIQALERQIRDLKAQEDNDASSLRSISSLPSANTPPGIGTPSSGISDRSSPSETGTPSNPIEQLGVDLKKLHANLEARLLPFWSSVLPGRLVEIQLFTSAPGPGNSYRDHGPITSQHVTTAADGSFQAKISIPWEALCVHPGALHIAFGESPAEWDLVAVAEVLPDRLPVGSDSGRASPVPSTRTPAEAAVLHVPISHTPLRVISDIDDTVKHSNIIAGTRTVFHNVFVKELSDLVIPGVGEWYTEIWSRGGRFHYVSNGPFEILSTLGEFFKIAELPPGSIKLRSYAGRSLFSGLLTAPAARKRAGVVELLEAFPQSKFILIGDSGEQDLELYADLSQERPEQILAVFIRHADEGPAVDDPTGNTIYHSPIQFMQPSRRPSFRRTLSGNSIDLKAGGSGLPYSVRTPRKTSNGTAVPGPLSAGAVPPPDYFTPTFSGEPEGMTDEEDLRSPTKSPTTLTYGRTPAMAIPSAPPHSASTPTTYTAPEGSPTSGPLYQPPVRSASMNAAYGKMTPTERKKYDLQLRVYRARSIMPKQIPLRLFKQPEECFEETRAALQKAGI